MKNIFKILSLAALLSAQSAFAITPENGWWWNPAQSGTGYNIETQNGTVFIATFVYDKAGNPVWYSGASQIDVDDTVSISLLQSDGGPCLGCIYAPPQTVDSGYQLKITFSSVSTATVSLGGVDTKIERFNFNLGNGPEQMLGVWIVSMISQFNRLGFSDTMVYRSVSDGMASGARAANNGGVSVAGPIADSGYYLSLTITPNDTKVACLFQFAGYNKIVGVTEVVAANASGEQIFNALKGGALAIGFRASSLQAVKNNFAKHTPATNGEWDAAMFDIQNEFSNLVALFRARGLTP
jgi:hypothetical protein